MAMSRSRAAQSVWQLFSEQRRSYSVGLTMPSSKSLWDIMKRELLEKHDAEHITNIWMEFHADPTKHRLAKVLPAAQYTHFAANASSSPMFVLPVFKGPNAFETFMVQCQLPLVLFTSLEEFKQRGPSSTPHFALTHYTELMGDKQIVLVRGDIIQPNAVSPLEASTLMRLVHKFYTEPPKFGGFVRPFNHKPSEFDFKRFMDSLGHDTSRLPS